MRISSAISSIPKSNTILAHRLFAASRCGIAATVGDNLRREQIGGMMRNNRGSTTAEKRHPGITMHRFTVGAGFQGLLFTVGCSLIFVIGLPALWSFAAFGTALGIGVAIFLRVTSNSRSERMKPLSILSPDRAEQKLKSRGAQERDGRKDLMLELLGLCST